MASLDSVVVIARERKSETSPVSDPLIVPIYHSSIYKFPSVANCKRFYDEHGDVYARKGNPTTTDCESAINEIEGGQGCLLFNSGMAAASTALLSVLKTGDHVVVQKPVYRGVEVLFETVLTDMGISASYVAGSSVREFREKIQPNTKMLYGETPCNPFLTILDLKEFAELGKETGTMTFVDGTFATPLLQPTLKFGIDISMHSCTKYLGGHSDVLAGSITTSSRELYEKMRSTRMFLGTILNPYTASLLRRGIQTLALRMTRHGENALHVAKFLEDHPKVSKVSYPGLPSHPQYDLAKKQMTGFGGVVTFTVKDGRAASIKLIESMNNIPITGSLGGVHTTIEHPASMSRAQGDADDTVEPDIVRLSVGIEDAQDIIADLKQGFDQI